MLREEEIRNNFNFILLVFVCLFLILSPGFHFMEGTLLGNESSEEAACMFLSPQELVGHSVSI